MPKTPELKFANGEFLYRVYLDSFVVSFAEAVALKNFADIATQKIIEKALNEKCKFNPAYYPPSFLDQHQKDGVRWILTHKRSYLAHAPGAGKTATAIVAAHILNEKTLFIVPPSLTTNWEREIYKFTEMLGVWPTIGIVPQTAKRDSTAWRAQFIICPDSMLTKEWVQEKLLELKFRFIAVDEASRLKEPSAERSMAFYGGKNKRKAYQGLYQNAQRVVFLDGSPLLNRPLELWAPAFALSPQSIDCMSMHEFGLRYCGGRYNSEGFRPAWEYKGATNQRELRSKLQNDFMHVVTEESLNHPERMRSIVYTNQDTRSAKHKTFEVKHINRVSGKTEESQSQGALATIRKDLGISKVDWAIRYISERLQANPEEKILVFAWHREVCEKLHAGLFKFNSRLVMGGTPNESREKYFKEFQDGAIRVIAGNIQAMGRGHNLQRADRIIFVEFSWTDELNRQCEKRASRRGRIKPVRCEYVAVPGSLDERILQSVFRKNKIFKEVIG